MQIKYKMKFTLLVASVFLGYIIEGFAETVISVSPDNRCKLVVSKMPVDAMGLTPQELSVIDIKTKTVVWRVRSIRRYTEAVWGCGGMLAINDKIANSGDYVYALEVNGNRVRILKVPDNFRFYKELSRLYPAKNGFSHATLSAFRWQPDGSLLVKGYAEVESKNNLDVNRMAEFDFVWKMTFLDGKWFVEISRNRLTK